MVRPPTIGGFYDLQWCFSLLALFFVFANDMIWRCYSTRLTYNVQLLKVYFALYYFYITFLQ